MVLHTSLAARLKITSRQGIGSHFITLIMENTLTMYAIIGPYIHMRYKKTPEHTKAMESYNTLIPLVLPSLV